MTRNITQQLKETYRLSLETKYQMSCTVIKQISFAVNYLLTYKIEYMTPSDNISADLDDEIILDQNNGMNESYNDELE